MEEVHKEVGLTDIMKKNEKESATKDMSL
jgi:hypothetical protein